MICRATRHVKAKRVTLALYKALFGLIRAARADNDVRQVERRVRRVQRRRGVRVDVVVKLRGQFCGCIRARVYQLIGERIA